jgi:hypothetical protein
MIHFLSLGVGSFERVLNIIYMNVRNLSKSRMKNKWEDVDLKKKSERW